MESPAALPPLPQAVHIDGSIPNADPKQGPHVSLVQSWLSSGGGSGRPEGGRVHLMGAALVGCFVQSAVEDGRRRLVANR